MKDRTTSTIIKRFYLAVAAIAFIAVFLIMIFGSYTLPYLGLEPGKSNGGLIINTLFIFFVVAVVPVLFLKGFSLLSRKVKHDDSHYDVKHIPDSQPRVRDTKSDAWPHPQA